MGNKLFAQVTGLTGLPEELIGEELKTLLERKGVAPEQVTMESLREALEDYLNQMAAEFAEEGADTLDELPAATAGSLKNKLS
ncbi:MAG TPA: hypothetical protein VIH99_01315 [Bdellovibrionota bacterium]